MAFPRAERVALLFKRMPVYQVKQWEEEQPYDIDKVPIKTEILDRCHIAG